MTYIYSRVSTEKQEVENQLHSLRLRFPNAEIVEETASGATDKPALNILLGRLQAGDTLVVAALDRLGRNAGKAIQLIDNLYARKVSVISIREGLDYSNPSGKFQGQIMLAMSELERNLISERTRIALAAKKAAGVRLGPPIKYDAARVNTIRGYRSQGYSIREISRLTLVSTGRICQLLKAG